MCGIALSEFGYKDIRSVPFNQRKEALTEAANAHSWNDVYKRLSYLYNVNKDKRIGRVFKKDMDFSKSQLNEQRLSDFGYINLRSLSKDARHNILGVACDVLGVEEVHRRIKHLYEENINNDMGKLFWSDLEYVDEIMDNESDDDETYYTESDDETASDDEYDETASADEYDEEEANDEDTSNDVDENEMVQDMRNEMRNREDDDVTQLSEEKNDANEEQSSCPAVNMTMEMYKMKHELEMKRLELQILHAQITLKCIGNTCNM